MKDLHSGVSIATLIGSATLAADNTPASIDRSGFEAVEIVLSIGVGGITFTGSNKVEFVLTHSDDDSTYTAVTDVDLLGVTGTSNGIIKTLSAAHAAAANYRFGYKGGKRYLKLLADFSGTHATGTPMSALAILGWANIKPTANQA